MKEHQKNIDRYRKVMRFGYGIFTVIWSCLMIAVFVFAADWPSAFALNGILAVLYLWLYVPYRRNVRQAVEEYRKRFE